MRTGLIAEKVGMSRIFKETGESVAVTVLRVDNCQVVAQKTVEQNGYVALQLGVGKARPNSVTKPMRGVFAQANVEPKKKLAEFRVDEADLLPVGHELKPSYFEVGQYVDVAGTSLGKGFAGGMKRWNFRGLRASHGVSLTHRSLGSTGQRQDPGRVFKGKKMAGHLGHERITVQSLAVIAVDDEAGLLFIKGGVPGVKGGYLYVKDSLKKFLKK